MIPTIFQIGLFPTPAIHNNRLLEGVFYLYQPSNINCLPVFSSHRPCRIIFDRLQPL